MKEITINEIDEVKNNEKAIVLIWAEGCEACENTKPYFDEISNKYVEFDFYKLKYSPEIMPFYNYYIPKEDVQVPAKYGNGDIILTVENKPLMIWEMKSPLLFPNFLVFTKELQDEGNDHGFVGNIPGFNKNQIEFILNEMSIQTIEQNHG